MCHGTFVKARGQLSRVVSLRPPRRTQGLTQVGRLTANAFTHPVISPALIDSFTVSLLNSHCIDFYPDLN